MEVEGDSDAAEVDQRESAQGVSTGEHRRVWNTGERLRYKV